MAKNMYDWVADRRFNPIKGICSHDCTYCYMRSYWPKMSEPRLDTVSLRRGLKGLKDKRPVFVGSGIDMWAEDIPGEWIVKVLERCKQYGLTYLFQSKNPERFINYLEEDLFPEKIILGTTIETDRSGISKAPSPYERSQSMNKIKELYPEIRRMVTIEPIIDFDHKRMIQMMEWIQPEFVNIGADSKGHGLAEPSAEKLEQLIKDLEKITEVRIKSNLGRLRREG